ncbi:hypothetical protein D918_06565 [Trichuris suis]|nr:hypothetical protein D918_06565 [Trichuris suis]
MTSSLENVPQVGILEYLAVVPMYARQVSTEICSIQKTYDPQIHEVEEVEFKESLLKRLVLLDGEEDKWVFKD